MDYSLFNSRTAEEIASELLRVKAVKLQVENPFTWASGWKSPIYCDNRITLSDPSLRTRIKECFSEAIKMHCPNAEAIAGVATAGIPQGALVADLLGLPFLYVRSKPKDHGMANLIEGRLEKGQRVVVIEDLISTGGSSIKAAEGIRDAGGKVERLLSIFNYGFQVAKNNFEQAGIPVTYLSDYPTLIKQAVSSSIVSSKDLETLSKWREAPENWGK